MNISLLRRGAGASRVLPLLLGAALLAPCASLPVQARDAARESSASERSLRPFASDEALRAFFRDLAAQRKQERDKQRARTAVGSGLAMDSVAMPATAPAPMAAKAAAPAAPAAAAGESVTNVQHAGVDEGGIVKVHGDHLVVLRRGRLFTVNVAGKSLRPVSTVDAYGPDVEPQGAWYDEMLISGNTVVVIGYSYARGGTEIGLFDIDRQGKLAHRATYHLRSNDYYSSRNYSSRLIGNKLIFYTPLYVSPEAADPLALFPALRKWRKGVGQDGFQPVVSSTRVYRPALPVQPMNGLALHTVTVCDLAQADMTCEGTAVLGPPGRVFYVAPDAVYAWVSERVVTEDKARVDSVAYRLPLDGAAPSALQVAGVPIDQFSFLASADQHLNVLVKARGSGEAMWGSEVSAGDLALLRVPVRSFGDGSERAPDTRYTPLPKVAGYQLQNRFVGDYLLVGGGARYARQDQTGNLLVVQWAQGRVHQLPIPHQVERIEALGNDALVVASQGSDLLFQSVRLGSTPDWASTYVQPQAAQGESRSHGFFYRADAPGQGVLGLPVLSRGVGPEGRRPHGSAAIMFLRNQKLALSPLGKLEASSSRIAQDGCRASCVDWYGNARPLFLRGRVFALMGYELVEGKLAGQEIREVQRVDFSPAPVLIAP